MLVVMVEVGVYQSVCLSLGYVGLAMVPPPTPTFAKSNMMPLGVNMWMHMELGMNRMMKMTMKTKMPMTQ